MGVACRLCKCAVFACTCGCVLALLALVCVCCSLSLSAADRILINMSTDKSLHGDINRHTDTRTQRRIKHVLAASQRQHDKHIIADFSAIIMSMLPLLLLIIERCFHTTAARTYLLVAGVP